MNGAWLPLWIIGGPFLGLLFLSSIYKGGRSASSSVDRRPSGEIPDYLSTDYRVRTHVERSTTLDAIARLSGPVSPGPIAELSGPKSPGAIASLSGSRSPGVIAKLSGHKSPGAISRLSGPKSPGAIAELSKSGQAGTIAKLSGGFYVSHLFGLPLLTRSQSPSEPDDSLLLSGHRPER